MLAAIGKEGGRKIWIPVIAFQVAISAAPLILIEKEQNHP